MSFRNPGEAHNCGSQNGAPLPMPGCIHCITWVMLAFDLHSKRTK